MVEIKERAVQAAPLALGPRNLNEAAGSRYVRGTAGALQEVDNGNEGQSRMD